VTNERRAEIAALLEADEPAARVLRAALTWAAETAQRPGDADDALEAVLLLDDALTDVGALVQALPGLLDAADVGPAAERHVRDRAEELVQLADTIAVARARRDALAVKDEELRARLDEHERLRSEVSELRRLERLVRVLDELEPHRRAIEARLEALRKAAGDTETAIAAAAPDLAELTEEALAALEPATRERAERLIAAQRSFDAEDARRRSDEEALAAAVERTDQLRRARDERVGALEAHARADRAIADGLATAAPDAGATAIGRARAALDDVEARLHATDEALSAALAALDETEHREHAAIAWSEAGS